MTTPAFVIGHDVIAGNLAHAPAGQLAGYATGTDGTNGTAPIKWPASAWQQHPDAVRIAQSPFLSIDEAAIADVLDVETDAGTIADVGPWAHAALVSFAKNARPGQRTPLVYASAVNITPVANALVAALLGAGQVGLWVANWSITEPQAVADVVNAAGPFPIHAFQFNDTGTGPSDTDVFSVAWLNHRSGMPPQLRTVPTVVGMTLQDAASTLWAAGLHPHGLPLAKVRGQSPGAGAKVPDGTVVTVTGT